MHNQEILRYEEDEIDLKELFLILMKYKYKIFFMTSIITILSVIYAYSATPIYDARAVVKVGEYKIVNDSVSAQSDIGFVTNDLPGLIREAQVVFIDILKDKKERKSEVIAIDVLKKQKNLFEIKAEAISSYLAKKEIQKVMKYLQDKHQKILNDVKEVRDAQVKQTEVKLSILKKKTLPTLTNKIQRYNLNIALYENNFKNLEKNLKKIKQSNPTLATIQINQQKYLADMLIKLRDSLERFEAQRDDIELLQISKLEERLNTLKSLMKPYNYKNTQIVGKIITSEHPIKPKKRLIVIVAFVTGFILSIFLVFFLEFLQGFKKEDFELSTKK